MDVRVGPLKKAERQRIDAFELWCWRRLLRVPCTARRSNQSILKKICLLGVHWKDWCWSWNSNTWATWWEELTHWKRPWCWKRLKAGGEGEDRGWDGWIASPTQWRWVWVDSWNLVKFISIESVMLSNHLILCPPLLLLPSIFLSIRIFSNKLAFPIRWPKYCSFSFSISPSNEFSGLIPFGLTGLISLQPKGLSRVFYSTTIWKHQLFVFQPSLWSISHICT